MIHLAGALRVVVGALDDVDARHLVVGSVAAAGWGVARTTRDVDVFVVLPPGAIDELVDVLVDGGLYVPVADARRAAAVGGALNAAKAVRLGVEEDLDALLAATR